MELLLVSLFLPVVSAGEKAPQPVHTVEISTPSLEIPSKATEVSVTNKGYFLDVEGHQVKPSAKFFKGKKVIHVIVENPKAIDLYTLTDLIAGLFETNAGSDLRVIVSLQRDNPLMKRK